MKEGEKLSFYSSQLLTAVKGNPEKTVWRSKITAQSYWELVRDATDHCKGYAGGIITRLQAQSDNPELNIVDIVNCETLDQLKDILEV
ncbi:hypothetical protein ACFL0F_00270 [Patescibacteria group bacterium]